jgi:ribosomal protein L37E
MSNELPARLRAWIECPRCGRIDKLTRDFRLPKHGAGPMLEKVGLACERCGEAAFIYLQRTVCNIH